jgi:hypothetical protein
VSAAAQNHADRAHARFAPSAAERWINCPGSMAAQEGEEDVTSSAAEDGNLAHEASAAVLEGEPFENATRALTPELAGIVAEYTAAVRGKFAALRRKDSKARLIVERRMHAPGIHPELFGTGDALMTVPGVLHVDDLKSGWKAVPVRYPDGRLNYQLGIYVLLALAEMGVTVSPWLFNPEDHGFERIVLTVHQPRVYDRPEQTRVTLDEMREFLDVVIAGIDRVEAGDRTRKANPSWCRYCLARGRCPELRAQAAKRARAVFSPENLPLEAAAEITAEADWLEAQVKGAREMVFRNLSLGREVPGSKLVAKKGRREWTDFETARQLAVAHGIEPERLYKREPISPAQMETLIQTLEDASEFPWGQWKACLETRSSGVTVAPANDPRPAIVSGAGKIFREAGEP